MYRLIGGIVTALLLVFAVSMTAFAQATDEDVACPGTLEDVSSAGRRFTVTCDESGDFTLTLFNPVTGAPEPLAAVPVVTVTSLSTGAQSSLQPAGAPSGTGVVSFSLAALGPGSHRVEVIIHKVHHMYHFNERLAFIIVVPAGTPAASPGADGGM